MRRLMRLVVTHGTGSRADAPGYFVGGKTGTAQKLDSRGQYMRGRNVTSFVGAFPMNAPRYALYVMLDEPHARAETGGHATAGLIAAPVFRRIVERVGPMLGMTPEIDRAVAIQASMALPFGGRPSRVSIPTSAPAAPMAAAPGASRPTVPAGPRANTAPTPAAQGFTPTPAPIRRTDATVGGPRVQLVNHPASNTPPGRDATLAAR
jgi:cell division protein FtsI (penicillin-binding protein 3)